MGDSASTRHARNTNNFLAGRRLDQIRIPVGITVYLQTLDIAVNKQFKDRLRTEIKECIESRMEKNQSNTVKPRLLEVVTWRKNLQDKIMDSCVANALRTGYVDRKTFEENSIV